MGVKVFKFKTPGEHESPIEFIVSNPAFPKALTPKPSKNKKESKGGV